MKGTIKMQNLSVTTRLHIMSALFVVSGILGVIGAMQITKGADMHKLNFLHVKYSHLFRSEVQTFAQPDIHSAGTVKQRLLLVRQQPIDCLAFIGWLDRSIMTLIGTDRAIELCELDLELANNTLQRINDYQHGGVDKATVIAELRSASRTFESNSEEFEPLVEKTVATVSSFVVWMIVAKAVFLAIGVVILSRSVSADYLRLKTTERRLEKDILKRKQAESDRDRLDLELRETARRAGMAEVATGVLHNVGNVLNSLNVSTTLICQRITSSPVASLKKAVGLVSEQKDRVGHFFEHDERGKRFPELLLALATTLEKERDSLLMEFRELMRNVDHIKAIVMAQQTFAKQSNSADLLDPIELFEDAIRMNDVILKNSRVEIIRRFSPVGEMNLQEHNVLQILVNLIRNSQQAFERSGVERRVITLSVTRDSDFVCFTVKDNGVGIEPENLGSIFKHGFTTKPNGHGFGLHACANSAQEMGGSLTVTSEGKGKGCLFTLRLPVFGIGAKAYEQVTALQGS